jgi:hypothetical protein
MKFKRTALAVSSCLTLAFALPAGATSTAPPQWHAAKAASLPTGARGLPQGFLPALSCSSAGNCSAGGSYSDAKSDTQGLILNEVKGVWTAPTKLIAPSGAAANPFVTVNSMSCKVAENCVAAGSYYDKAGNAQSFVVAELGGRWQSMREVVLPPRASATARVSEIHAVSCWSVGNCSAIGDYLDSTTPVGHSEAMVVSEVRGKWSRAVEVKLPAGVNANPYVTISQLTCSSNGRCVAVGSYIDANNSTQGLILAGTNGTWGSSKSVTLPGNANAYPGATLNEVACVSAGNCTALGTYTNATGHNEGMSVMDVRGTWQRADAMAMPANAATNPRVFFYGYGGLSCASIGNCSAGGQYLVGTSTYEGFFINEVNGTWDVATQMVLPAGAQMAGKNGGVVAVSCRSGGNCSAGAAYVDGSGQYQALVVNEVGGTWKAGQKITLPTGASSVGVDGGVYGLVCHTTGPCTATGSYLTTSTNYEGFTVTTS